MKRSIQNIFMLFTLNGTSELKRISNKRKMSLVATFSNPNRPLEDMHLNQTGYIQKEDNEFYTLFDLDAENAAFANEKGNNSDFIFDAIAINRIDHTALKPEIIKENRIISTHWAELADFDLINQQKHEKKAQSAITYKTTVDYDKDYKSLLSFN